MNSVVDFARVSMYRKVKEVEARIDELGAMIDASDDFSVRGPLKAKQYALRMKLAALQASLLPPINLAAMQANLLPRDDE